MPRFSNVTKAEQEKLLLDFSWLYQVHHHEIPNGIRQCSISVFDHCLSNEEATRLLDKVSSDEQHERDVKHSDFCRRLIDKIEIVSFRFKGRKQDQVRFRKFSQRIDLEKHLTKRRPNGGEYGFQVIMPELKAAFYWGYDDTSHLYFRDGSEMALIHQLVLESGLYVF